VHRRGLRHRCLVTPGEAVLRLVLNWYPPIAQDVDWIPAIRDLDSWQQFVRLVHFRNRMLLKYKRLWIIFRFIKFQQSIDYGDGIRI